MKNTKICYMLILAAILSSVFTLTAVAAEIHVPEDYATIQEAVDAASAGDSVIIGPGTYEEDVNIDGKSNITIRASDPGETQIQGTVTISGCADITLEDLNITSPTGDGIKVEGVNTGLTFRNNVITGCAGSGINFEGANYSDVTIEGNQINNNGFDGIRLVGTGENVNITGNTINNNGATEAQGIGIRIGGNVSDVTIEDNTIEGNAFANIHPQS